MPSLLRNLPRRSESWFFRSSIRSRAGRKLIDFLGIKPVDLDQVERLTLGPHGLSEPMERAIDQLDSRSLGLLTDRFARRYPSAHGASGILRTAVLQAVAGRALEAFYGLVWARSLGYEETIFVGSSRWDWYLLNDPAHEIHVKGSLSRACSTVGHVIKHLLRLVHSASTRKYGQPTSSRTSPMVTSAFMGRAWVDRSVLIVLNKGMSFGGLYSYDWLFSEDPASPLHRDNAVVIARNGDSGRGDGDVLGFPGSGSRFWHVTAWLGFLVIGMGVGGLRVPWSVLDHLARVCTRVDGQRVEIARHYPSLRLAILAYDIQVPSDLVLALESLAIPTAAVNERPQSVIWGLQPFSVSTLLTASSYFSEAALASRSVSITSAVAVGMWRTDLLHQFRAGPPHEEYERACLRGQKFVLALPYASVPRGEWIANPLAVGVQSITDFLEDLAELAERMSDVLFMVRGKGDSWVTDDRFAGIAARVLRLPNIAVSRRYDILNESYRLCAAADLIIAKHTSLVDEALAVGIPCVLHDFTRNSQGLSRSSVRYLPRRLWAENREELQASVDFALHDDGASFREWWEPHRFRIYGNLSDGGVMVRARTYLSNLEQQRPSWP